MPIPSAYYVAHMYNKIHAQVMFHAGLEGKAWQLMSKMRIHQLIQNVTRILENIPDVRICVQSHIIAK